MTKDPRSHSDDWVDLPREQFPELTAAEVLQLGLLVNGYTASEAASRTGLTARTVQTHRYNLARRLGLRSGLDVTRVAMLRLMNNLKTKTEPAAEAPKPTRRAIGR